MATDPRYAVVLTACIDPGRAAGPCPVRRSDPEARLADYARGLRFWLRLRNDRIRAVIFLENSGFPLDRLADVVSRENVRGRTCELISLNCNEHVDGVSYGYSEFKLLDLGLERSAGVHGVDYLIKATGRYLFPDVRRLMSRLPHPYLVAADSRDNGWLRHYHQRIVSAHLMFFGVDFFDTTVRTLYRGMRPYAEQPRKSFIEDVLYDTLIPMRDHPGVILRWPCNCEPQGVGGNGTNLSAPRRRALAAARAIGRVVCPTWWV